MCPDAPSKAPPKVQSLVETPDRLKPFLTSQLREIFFLTSTKKEFPSEGEKENFFKKWTSHYLDSLPQFTYLAIQGNDILLGYLTGDVDTEKSLPMILKNHPYLEGLKHHLKNYPAHFHINCHPDHQGYGIGGLLVSRFIEDYRRQSTLNPATNNERAKGVHIITSKEALNVSFYEKMGFHRVEELPWKGNDLLLMGKKL